MFRYLLFLLIAADTFCAGWKTFEWGMSKDQVLQEIKSQGLRCNDSGSIGEVPVCHTAVGSYKATVKFILHEKFGLKHVELFIIPEPAKGKKLSKGMRVNFTRTLYRAYLHKYGIHVARTKDETPTHLWHFVENRKTAVAFIELTPAVKVKYSGHEILAKIRKDKKLEEERKKAELKANAMKVINDI